MSKVYRINEFAKRIGRAPSTVRRWERDDLQSQGAAMEEYWRAGAIAADEWVQEVGGGMNFKRKRFLVLIERIQRGEIERVLIAHKDRFVRFGFDLLDHLAHENGCEIIMVNQESLSPEQEMVKDLPAIVDTSHAACTA
ncbi:putative site-specific integrase-resolvase [Cupriavidus oxalaticus]|uniref:Site-specific integrase-resolvase n=1 Tax=Cupriavidus oxalaticus TaxID=96344 RepID=A0A375G0Y5_9BURK|nr:putative site-specific integrase-resolvase [Cupriavidus oxalaticus]SPC14303.1 putative site-specific integrase-resolvase [Cupriavidus oxalaticus]